MTDKGPKNTAQNAALQETPTARERKEATGQMTREELRIRVAELFPGIIFVWPDGRQQWRSPAGIYHDCVNNDILQDLNACHEFEKLLFTNDNTLKKAWPRYCKELRMLTLLPEHAKAEQRCRAFIATMEASQDAREGS